MTAADTLKAVTTRLVGLPPDPDGLNESRGSRAAEALRAYASLNHTDEESMLYDLLVDLRHWSDRNGKDFTDIVTRSEKSYLEEATPWPES